MELEDDDLQPTPPNEHGMLSIGPSASPDASVDCTVELMLSTFGPADACGLQSKDSSGGHKSLKTAVAAHQPGRR